MLKHHYLAFEIIWIHIGSKIIFHDLYKNPRGLFGILFVTTILIGSKTTDKIRCTGSSLSIWSFLAYPPLSHWHIEAETKWPSFRKRHIQMHFLEWWYINLIYISVKFVPLSQINNIPALFQIMAWRRPGDIPLSEPMIVYFTDTCLRH